jgi:hypothetical protein
MEGKIDRLEEPVDIKKDDKYRGGGWDLPGTQNNGHEGEPAQSARNKFEKSIHKGQKAYLYRECVVEPIIARV